MTCHGNGERHCCWLPHVGTEGVESRPCPHLEERTVDGRRWVCGLLRQLGSWDAVHGDARYLANVKPVWTSHGVDDCGVWGISDRLCCFGADNPAVNGV